MVAKMRSTTRDIDKGYKKLVKDLGSMDGAFAKVGILGTEKYSGPEHSGMLVVDIAVQNEFGAENIPSRPFMRQTFSKKSDQLNKVITEQISLIYNKGKDYKKALSQVATWYADEMKDTVKSGEFAPNSPVTVKIKGSSRPLIDTGRMWQSITWVLIE